MRSRLLVPKEGLKALSGPIRSGPCRVNVSPLEVLSRAEASGRAFGTRLQISRNADRNWVSSRAGCITSGCRRTILGRGGPTIVRPGASRSTFDETSMARIAADPRSVMQQACERLTPRSPAEDLGESAETVASAWTSSVRGPCRFPIPRVSRDLSTADFEKSAARSLGTDLLELGQGKRNSSRSSLAS